MKNQKIPIASRIATKLARWMRSPDRPHNHEHRDYLGMSAIGGCPRDAYWSVVDPERNDSLHWYSWAGYMFEFATIELLRGAGHTIEQPGEGYEIIAGFDQRYRGHIDGILYRDGERILLEIKSVNFKRFFEVLLNETPMGRHYSQVQAYIAHDEHGFDRALIVYVARNIPHQKFQHEDWKSLSVKFPGFRLFEIDPDPDHQAELDDKAKMILKAIDAGTPPECTCFWCDR